MVSNLAKGALLLFLYFMLVILGGVLILLPFQQISEIILNFNFNRISSLIASLVYLYNYVLVSLCLIGIIESTDYTPFIFDNVKRFKKMGYCLFVNAIIECILGYNDPKHMHLIGVGNGGITFPMIICIISALMCFVIGEVFDKAIKIKEENDLTV
ncbi:DUF2975 domain-containing protein [Paraclostridium ghonii]|uniref:DUF2975 domain-containing protein n=1 Tax=Paraclostridium ghonii TaxID=29358 RepID=UPI00202CBA0A|nr:DUF2975 domain-containing protein [Paeniclostridium ghonii]MCM0168206.1 DUF2975 domain-containing protein [Paeniclostridium ghonii]